MYTNTLPQNHGEGISRQLTIVTVTMKLRKGVLCL
jgi:hypothetical protein